MHYYTVSILKDNNNNFNQSFYEDGICISSGVLNKKNMEILSSLTRNLLTVGSSEQSILSGTTDESNLVWWANMTKMDARCLRIYNRGLTDNEAWNNYDKTTYYHNEVMGKELK